MSWNLGPYQYRRRHALGDGRGKNAGEVKMIYVSRG